MVKPVFLVSYRQLSISSSRVISKRLIVEYKNSAFADFVGLNY